MEGLFGFMLAGLALLANTGPATLSLAATGAAFGARRGLAYCIATAPPLLDSTQQHHQPSFMGGMFLSLVNPKAYAVLAALFSGFVLVEEGLHIDAALKTIILLTILSITNTAWLFAGAALTRFARDPNINRAINVTFAVLLVASVIFAQLF